MFNGNNQSKDFYKKSNFTTTFTEEGTRLCLFAPKPESDINIIFVPGGPGINSDYFEGLAKNFKFNANVWLLDLPDNGNNIRNNTDYNKWSSYLVNALKRFENIILIGHSFSGALIISEPEIQNYVKSIILITSPIENFKDAALIEQTRYNLPDIHSAIVKYNKNPTNETVKNLAIDLVDYYFTPDSKLYGKSIFQNMIWNHKPLDWANREFWPNFNPKFNAKVPTLILAGAQDHVVPNEFLKKHKSINDSLVKYVVIENAGHFPWIEQQELCLNAIKDFLLEIL